MDKIEYTVNSNAISYKSSDNGPIINLKSKYIKYFHIYTHLDTFMEYNPPCKECLIQSMCIKIQISHPIFDMDPDHLSIKTCDRLKGYIDNNKNFYYHKLKRDRKT